jgi:hypothetical protein
MAPRNERSKSKVDTNMVELDLQFYEKEKMPQASLEGTGRTCGDFVERLSKCQKVHQG